MAKKKNVQIEKVKKVKTEILLREFEEKEIGEIVVLEDDDSIEVLNKYNIIDNQSKKINERR